MRFEIRQRADAQFVFELRDEDRLLLTSRPFADREAVVNAVQATVDAIEEAEGYDAVQSDAGYIQRVYDADGGVLAESPASASETEANALGAALLEGAARSDDYEVTITTTTTDAASVPLAFRSMREVDPASYYDFDAIGASRTTGGQSFEDGGEYYYVVNDGDGQPLLFTRHYATAGPRNKRMRSVLEAAGRDSRYETVEEGGQTYFIVKARNGMEIARSRAFTSAAAMTAAIGYLQGYAPAAYQDVKTTRRRGGGSDANDYDFTLTSTTNEPGFDAYRAGPGQFVFLFNDEGGQPILFSQGYSGRSSRDNGIKAVIRNAGEEGRYELKEENGEHFFILRAGNRREIARSRVFPSAAAALAAMAFLRRQAPTFADQYGIVLADQTRTRTDTESFTVRADPREAVGGALGAAALGLAGAALSGGDDEAEETESADGDSAVAGAVATGLSARTGAGVAGVPLSEDDDEETGAAAVPLAGAAAVGGTAAAASSAPAPRERVTPVAAAGGGGVSGAAAGATSGAAAGGGCMKWLLPLLLALLLLFLLLWFLRGCAGCGDVSGEESSGIVDGDAAEGSTDAVPLPLPADSMEVDTTTAELGMGIDTTATAADEPTPEPAPEPTSEPAPVPEPAPAPEPEPAPAPVPEPEPAAAVPSAPDVSGAVVPRAAASGFDLDNYTLTPGSMEAQLLAYLNGSEPAGRSFVFSRVNYPSGDHPIDASGAEQAFLVGEILKRFPNVRATIHGHIDGMESETYTGPNPRGSMTLSQLRAHCVWQRLVYQGVPRSQIEMVGHANSDPVGSDDMAEGRQANRRVEIEITRK